jgi:hypothetical protein
MATLEDITVLINRKAEELNKLELRRKNILEFIERHGDNICGPDGVFGALCDEILLNVMCYLGPNELLLPPCRRFRELAIDALTIATKDIYSSMSEFIRNNMIKYLFIYRICYHVFLYHHKYKTKTMNHAFGYHEKGAPYCIQYSIATRKIIKTIPCVDSVFAIEYKYADNILKIGFTDKNTQIYHIHDNIIKLGMSIRNDGSVTSLSEYAVTVKPDGIINTTHPFDGPKCLFKRAIDYHNSGTKVE